MIIQYYTRLCEVIVGLIELSKSYCYAQQQKHINGIEKPVNIEIEIKAKQENIKQMKVSETIQALGVYINPYLDQSKQFELIKKKLTNSVTKLMNASMSTT